MAEENQNISHGYQQPAVTSTQEEESEIKDRGLFDFLGKKKEEEEEEKIPTADHQNVVIATELEHVHVSGDQCDQEPEKKVVVHEVDKEDEKKKPHASILDKLHRSDSSSSSSSSDEEVEENGEKIRRKKKKGLKEKIHEKISGDAKVEEPEKKIDYYKEEDTAVPVEKCDDVVVTHDGVVPHPEEKKGFLEKIKEKFPGGHKKTEEDQVTHPVAPVPTSHPVEYTSSSTTEGEEAKEKKGFLEKIKEKLPGYHKSEEEAKKETKDTPSNY